MIFFPVSLISVFIYLLVDFTNAPTEDKKLIVDKKELERELIKISGKKEDSSISLNKINPVQENSKSISSPEEKYEQVLAFTNNNSHSIKEFEEVKISIAKSKDSFNELIEKKFKIALETNNQNELINILKVASMIPIGRSQLVNDAESIILKAVQDHKVINVTLLKAALNFYFIQLQYFNEDIGRKKREMVENCKDENTKALLIREFKNFKPSKGKVYESN